MLMTLLLATLLESESTDIRICANGCFCFCFASIHSPKQTPIVEDEKDREGDAEEQCTEPSLRPVARVQGY